MAIPRREQIDSENPGYYHLISRCVRRSFLCGFDAETGINYEHRRQWIENRLLQLADVFAIEVYAYAVMSNHYHLVVYSNPKAPEQWSDLTVAERWLKAFPGKIDKPEFQQQRQLRLQAIVNDKELLATYRKRLGDISWLMRRLNEPLARLANLEDGCKGHFWESRFTSQALLDESAALACMAYVDLNPIRAGMSQSLQTSEHTSIKKRVESMTPGQLNQAVTSIAGNIKARRLNLKLNDYIELVEWTGKNIVYPNKTAIPPHIQSVLAQLNINHSHWLSQIQHYGTNYGRFVGCIHSIKAKVVELEQRWIQGSQQLQQLFSSV
ncbi:transposase [Aliikangiella sp. IMCC44359]|uniref:transposase n=1 Tax=Aliikangiella sp. IMCC44359 TaxID=3459125 RepID=UPI00403B13A8